MAKSDPVLEAFDRLRVRKVNTMDGDTASFVAEFQSTASFLAEFQSTAASLEPEERIELVVYEGVELLSAVLVDPQASKMCALRWWNGGEEDANSVIPLLINNCPELTSLQVDFKRPSGFDFVSSVLEHPGNKLKVLEIPEYTGGDLPRYFAALEQSQVLSLSLFSDGTPEFEPGFRAYLAKDLLVRFKVWNNKRVASEMMVSLAECTRLAKLEMFCCEFLHLPKSITNLVLSQSTFVGGLDWSFLVDSSMRELNLYSVGGVDGTQLGSALAVHLRTKGLDKLQLCGFGFVNETLAAVGVELGRVKRLDLENSHLEDSCVDDASIALIAHLLQSTTSEVKVLTLEYNNHTASGIESHLVPALRHPNCHLAELRFSTCYEHGDAARRVGRTFCNRRALLVLLQGRQGRRKSPLRRLPLEMFRLVGEVLM